MATIGVAKKVALETTRKSAPGKRKKTRLLKDDIDNACKNMKMLATAPAFAAVRVVSLRQRARLVWSPDPLTATKRLGG